MQFSAEWWNAISFSTKSLRSRIRSNKLARIGNTELNNSNFWWYSTRTKQDFLNRTFWKTEKQITKFRKSAIVGVWSACRLFENNIIKSVFLLCVWWYSTSRAVANRDQQSPNYIFAIKNIQLLEVVYRGVLFASLCLKRRHSWDNVRTLVTPTDN